MDLKHKSLKDVAASSEAHSALAGCDVITKRTPERRLPAHGHNRSSYREAEAIRFDKEEAAHRTFHPARPGVSQLVPHLLRSGVFSAGHASGDISRTFRVHRHDSTDAVVEDQRVRYDGPQLRQFHKRVLLGLLLLAAGKDGGVTLVFNAQTFLRSIGRDDSTANVGALRRALVDLRRATFTISTYAGDSGEVFGLISEATWVRRTLTVTMSRRLAFALQSLGRTYIPMRQRNLLADGVQTALADLIWSTSVTRMQVTDLAAMWGREHVQLGREITVALGKLKAAGVLKSFNRRRNAFDFERDLTGFQSTNKTSPAER